MENPSSELHWLDDMTKWVRHCEEYISVLNTATEITPDEAESLNEWSEQCNEIRQIVEHSYERLKEKEQDNLIADIDSILKKALHLQHQFQQFSERKIEAESSDRLENQAVPIGEHTLPPLPYDYDALEPHISEEIMRLHHDEHHKSYVDGLNKAEKEMKKARQTGDFSLIRHWEGEAAFNGAGHYLHTIFWNNMSPQGGGAPHGKIEKEINRTFGSFDRFKKHFTNAANKVQGVGWALLVWSPRSWRTEILQAEKHQNLSQQDVIPLLVLDVWEHAYYLQYTNNRKDYIDAWWNVVNWDHVNRRFKEAKNIRWQPF